jgi:hypothetical protein
MKAILLALLVLFLPACSNVARNSSEAAWRRAQCEQILDEKMRLKCLERVDDEY